MLDATNHHDNATLRVGFAPHAVHEGFGEDTSRRGLMQRVSSALMPGLKKCRFRKSPKNRHS